ncbi:MAG: hypothetical protein HQK54_12645, partial [Oligoflexales bacterium]|nr:hypothetical protein [Oligoflexales bacterium]
MKKDTLQNVIIAIVVCYAVMFLFQSRGIFNWVIRQPIESPGYKLKKQAQKHWSNMSKLGFEEPAYSSEVWFHSFRDGPSEEAPKKYATLLEERSRAKMKKGISSKSRTNTILAGKDDKMKKPPDAEKAGFEPVQSAARLRDIQKADEEKSHAVQGKVRESAEVALKEVQKADEENSNAVQGKVRESAEVALKEV